MPKGRTRNYTDAEVYALVDQGLLIREIQTRISGSPSMIAAIVMHGRKFGLCKPFTEEQKKRKRGSRNKPTGAE